MKSIALLLSAFPLFVSAQPDAAIRYLMSEPASLLDIGLIRLNDELEEMSDRLREWYETDTDTEGVAVTTATEYFSDDDKIRVHVNVTVQSPVGAESGCRGIIGPLKDHVARMEIAAFRHNGYTESNRPEDLASRILEQTELLCHVFEPRDRSVDITVKYSFGEDSTTVLAR